MNFIVGLPRTKANHDAIWVIEDRLTKSAHFLPINERFSLDKLVHIVRFILKYSFEVYNNYLRILTACFHIVCILYIVDNLVSNGIAKD